MTATSTRYFFILILSFVMLPCAHGIDLFGKSKTTPVAADKSRLIVSPQVRLLEIDGAEQNPNFFNSGDTVMELMPGYHELTVRYEKIWNINYQKFEGLESAPITLPIVMEGGKSYRITHRKLNSYQKAKVFSEKPEFFIVDADSGALIPEAIKDNFPKPVNGVSVGRQAAAMVAAPPVPPPPETRQDKGTFSPAVNPGIKDKIVKASGRSLSTVRPPALHMLKYWWEQAGVEEKQRFYEWIQNSRPLMQ